MAAIPNNEGPTKNTRRIYDHAGWVPNKSVVRMWLHRGGGYINNPDIHEGGAWVEKEGVLFVPAGQSGQFDTAWFVGFDGDFQMTNPTPDYCYFPDGPKTVIRAATAADLARPAIARDIAIHGEIGRAHV